MFSPICIFYLNFSLNCNISYINSKAQDFLYAKNVLENWSLNLKFSVTRRSFQTQTMFLTKGKDVQQ